MGVNAQTFQFLLSQVRASGVVLSGGKVYFYAAGTQNLKTVWLDRGKTTEAANPYTLDANGTAQVFGDGLYDVVIKDASNVTKYEWENISIRDVSGNVYDVADYGNSLNAAVASIGSTPATLQYASNVTVAANLVVPSTLELMPLNGAKINHTTYTIEVNSSTARWPLAQVFSGAGAVTLTGANIAYPEWWGVDPSGVASSTAAFNKWASCGCKKLRTVPNATYKIKDVTLPGNSGTEIDLGFSSFIADGINGAPATCCFQVTFTAPSEDTAYWMNAWKFHKATLVSGYCVDFLVVNIVESALITDVYIRNIRNKGAKQGDTDPMNALVKINKTSSMTPESFEVSHLNNNAGGLVDRMVHLTGDSSLKSVTGYFHHIFQNVYDVNARAIYGDNCGVSRSRFEMIYNAGGAVLDIVRATTSTFDRIYQEALIVNSTCMKGTYQYCDFKQITVIRQAGIGGEKLFNGIMYECVWESCEHLTGIVDATTGVAGLGTTKTFTLLPGSQYNIIKDIWSTLDGHQYWTGVDDQGTNNWFGDRPATGTYTPVITVTGATVELAAGYSTLSYRRERDRVKVSGILKVGAITGTPSGALSISLPYSCASGNSQSTALPVVCSGFAAGMTSPANAYVDPGAKSIAISGFAAGDLVAIGGYLQANSFIRVGVEYIAKRDLT